MNVGLIGCGNISGIYLKNAARLKGIEIVACADMIAEKARGKADEFGIDRVCTVDELLSDPGIDIILNLTVPNAHYSVSLAALEAGKHVYVEKPLAINRDDGLRLIRTAADRNLRIGAAPDTFLGGGLQTCRQLIDEGAIGQPVAATAFMLCHGHESWHPDPAFYYEKGGGPMFDMGPYYLTALISLLGPVKRLTGSARITFPERTITSQPRHGTKITVETATHVAGVLDFESGAIGTLVTSFDVWAANVPLIEIYGSEGSLSVPDSNTFGGRVGIRRAGEKEWQDVALTHGYTENWRGLGLADMASSIEEGRHHRASGDLAYHVLDIMQGIHDASESGCHCRPQSGCPRPEPLDASQSWERAV